MTLHVAAASDLQAALPALITRFNQITPDVEVLPTFGSSGQLARQIEAGAPFDVFLAANEAYVDDLAARIVIDPATVRRYAMGSLVIVVGSHVKERVETVADLTRPGVKKLAIANPDVAPYGVAAKAVLKNAKVWEALKPKLVIGESVRQALQFAQTGNVEAALVGRAIAKAPGLRVVEIPPHLNRPIVQRLGVVTASDHPTEARAFANFVFGKSGRAILVSFGFEPPPSQLVPESTAQ